MASKSMELGDEAPTSLLWALIKSQILTRTQRAPADTNLTGQVAIITGASESAADKLRADYPDAKLEVWHLEMTSYPSIQAFCRRVEAELPRLDITILNAGLMHLEFTTCETGHEEILQVNYLSTFLMAILMLPICKSKAPSGTPGRLTIVSSGTALFAKLSNRDKRPFLASFDDPDIYPFDPPDRYFSSKALGHLFFVRMLEYLNADDVVVNLVEPGMVKGTGLHRDAKGLIGLVLAAWKGLWGRTLDDGAWMYVDAAVVKGKESHGCFVMDWKIHPFARLVYLPEGKDVMDVLWEETLAEFEFVGARQILEAFKKG
ncbi:putative short-chain dehydrogenase/reductase family protein [Coniochaeta ligniaria NRRL 30616]|uniref:Putative short-chain dehydrogenase/reductase family protein n=1 Tax=Coniochaeta ligniaria NRRL 30616 TaxID=1408157 RepID=A0A1J7J7U1_9PEZI|nr:putative short-chain dehydrogenase/reductase family protein [Coniochaeta ligniaria NRRL 30616]